MMKKKLAMLCSVSMLLALPGCCGWRWCKKRCDDETYESDHGERKHKKTKQYRENGGRRMKKTETEETKY
ncbi:MAG TPA: hypothetical protein VGW78_03030 [Candidatus Babeliales bacterium]|jgi:hypothetical protein|nr:hypothetical protein [Candidatus Babeliales bacterium]